MLKSQRMLSAFVALLAATSVALGQDPPAEGVVVQRLMAGYSRSVRSDGWFPVHVLLTNSGPERDVELVLSAFGGAGETESFLNRAPMHLPARSQRRATLYMVTDNGAALSLDVLEGGDRIARGQIEPTYLSPRDLLVLGLSANNQSFTAQPPRETLGYTTGRIVFNNSMDFSELPARRQGYAAVEGMILGALPAAGIPVAQQAAIVDWVRSGGVLILSPGGMPPNYAGTLIDAICPVEAVGERWVEDLPPLAEIYGPLAGEKQRIGLSEVMVRDGDVRLQMGLFPLIVARREGAGHVIFLAFDAANERLANWPPMRLFYRDIFEARGALPDPARTPLPQMAAALLNERVGTRVLPRWALGICLAANLCLVVALLVLWRGRREWAYALLVVAAPVTGLVINMTGKMATGGAEVAMSGIQVIQSGSGDRQAAGAGYYAFSSQGEGRCDVRLPAELPGFLRGIEPRSAHVYAPVGSVRETIEFADEDLKWLRQIHVRPRSVTLFQAGFDMPLPGALEATATVEKDGIRFEVTNNSSVTVSGIAALCNRNAAVIGTLYPGESGAALLTRGSAQGMLSGFARKTIRSRQEVEYDRIIQALFSALRIDDLVDSGPLILGWVDGWPVPAQVTGLDPAPTADAQTLWSVNAVRRRAESGTVLFPRGTTPLRIEGDIGESLAKGAWKPIARRIELNLEFIVPAAYRPLKAGRMAFFLETGLAPAAASIEVWNIASRQYDCILGEPREGRVEPVPPDLSEFLLPNPENCLEPSTGKARFRVAVQPAQSAGAALVARAMSIESLDLEIEGTLE